MDGTLRPRVLRSGSDRAVVVGPEGMWPEGQSAPYKVKRASGNEFRRSSTKIDHVENVFLPGVLSAELSAGVGQANKGARRMPWRQRPTKDAVTCEKLRGAGSKR